MVENDPGTSGQQHGTGKPGIRRSIVPRFSIGTRFICSAILIALLAGGVVGLVTINTSLGSLRQSVLHQNLDQAELAAQFASNYMKVIQADVRAFATRPAIIQAVLDNELERAQPELASFVQIQTVLNGAGIYDINGIQKAYSIADAVTVGQSFTDRDWFQQTVATSQPYQSIPIKSKGTGVPISTYAIPILDGRGQIRAVVSAGISLGRLSDAIVNINYGTDTSATMIDFRNGGFILADRDPQLLITPVSGKNEAVSRLLAGKHGAIETTDSTGELDLVGFAAVPDLPWGVMVITPSKTALAVAHALTQNTILFTGLIILFAAILGGVFVLQITRPLLRLVEGTKEVGRGNLDYKVTTTRRDEIGDLSRAFGDMTEKLKNTLVSRDELVKEVAERKKIENSLEKANKEMEAFAYSVSHDLRAPLRGIDGFSQALLEDYPDKLDEQGKNYLQRVRSAAQRMGVLIDDLLSLSRVTRSDMRQEAVDLSALAQSIAEEFRETQPERHVAFIITPGLTVSGDVRLLRVLIENLLSNAWKFTGHHPQARIEFGVTQIDGKETFFVRDNGAGFDMTYANKLFGVFQRLHSQDEFPGTGVGLATVQRIVHRHGGKVWAEGAVGKGATFYFTLKQA